MHRLPPRLRYAALAALWLCLAGGGEALARAAPPAAADRAFEAEAWRKAGPKALGVRKSMVRDLEAGGKLSGLIRDQVVALLGKPDEVREGALVYRLPGRPIGAFDASALMVLVDEAGKVTFTALEVPETPTEPAVAAERPFDPKAWPKELVINNVPVTPGSTALTPVPAMGRKAMARDLVRSHRLVGLSRAEVLTLLGTPQDQSETILVYGLGDAPVGDFNPYALAVVFEAAKATSALLVDRKGDPI